VGASAVLEALGKGVHGVKKDFRVALCGYYGYGNLGDELLAEALVTLLEKEGVPREEMVILSGDPSTTENSLETHAVNRNQPLAVWRTLRTTETFLLGGGGLFQDTTSLRSCMYYWATVRMAERAGCILWAFGQSIGPLARRLSTYFAFDALRRCTVRVVRDEHSQNWLAERKLEARKGPDPVFALSVSGETAGEGDFLLLNVRPWRDDLPRRTVEAVQEYASRSRREIIGVALSPEDESCMTDFQEKGIIRFREIKRITSGRDASELWQKASAAYGMRLHFCVLSVMAGLPCVAIPYDPKVSSFAKEWCLPVWGGDDPLPTIEKSTDLSKKLETTRQNLAETMHGALKTVFPGGFHGD
jgi:polysaccharide pyruvyl transferase CsaB